MRVLKRFFPVLFLGLLLHTCSWADGPSDLPMAVLLAPVRAPDGLVRMHVWLEIPGEAVPTEPVAWKAHAHAEDAEGKVWGEFQRSINLEGDALERARGSGLKLHGDLSLKPGSYGLRLRIGDGDTVSAQRFLPFEVTAYETDKAAVLPPFFIDDDGDAVVIRDPDAAEDGSPDPFVTSTDEPFVPKVVPVLANGIARARITLVGYHLTGEKSLLEGSLFDSDGSLLGKDRLGLIAQSETGPDGLDRLDFSLQTEGLWPGEYQLEVSIQDLEHGRTDQSLMPFRIE